MKKTIEEVAEEWFNKDQFYPDPKQGFLAGAKYQSEQSEYESLNAENNRLKEEIKALDEIIKNFDVNH